MTTIAIVDLDAPDEVTVCSLADFLADYVDTPDVCARAAALKYGERARVGGVVPHEYVWCVGGDALQLSADDCDAIGALALQAGAAPYITTTADDPDQPAAYGVWIAGDDGESPELAGAGDSLSAALADALAAVGGES